MLAFRRGCTSAEDMNAGLTCVEQRKCNTFFCKNCEKLRFLYICI